VQQVGVKFYICNMVTRKIYNIKFKLIGLPAVIGAN